MYCVAISIVSVISRSIIIICDVVVVALVSSRCVCEVSYHAYSGKFNSVIFQFRIIICNVRTLV